MDDLKTMPLPEQDILDNNLDPYKAAPQQLKDLWKSWTKTKAPFPEVNPFFQAVPLILPESILVENFTCFVLGHLFTLFNADSRALASFTEELSSLEKGEMLSMKNAVPSGIPDQTPYKKEEFMEYAKSKLILPLQNSCKSGKPLSCTYKVARVPGREISCQISSVPTRMSYPIVYLFFRSKVYF
jgi:hypothetical protein